LSFALHCSERWRHSRELPHDIPNGRAVKRSLIALAALLFTLGTIAIAQNASTLLPNGWRIAAPSGPVSIIGTLPEGIALSHDGRSAFVLEAGHQKPVLRVLDAHALTTIRSVPFAAAYGTPLRDANADGVWIADTQTFGEQIAHVDTASGHVDRTVSLPIPFFAVAIARSPDNRTLAVAGDLAHEIVMIDLATGAIRARATVGRHPAALVFAPNGKTVYVADRAEHFVDAVALNGSVRTRIPVGLHPDAIASDGRRLYVADADDDDLTVIDIATERAIAHVPVPFYRDGLVGVSPNAIALDGERIYVSCGAANAIAVYRATPQGATAIGAIATGWYPTGLAVDHAGNALLIVNGKGESSHANPGYRPNTPNAKGYIADQLTGSVRRIAIPSYDELRAGVQTVRALAQHAVTRADPVVRANGPIKHVIYIIKENRTYDQVLGDVAAGDGDKSLVLFGADITPNLHAIVGRFGVFDRFFANAHVSADGHSWSTAAFANDYLEKMWPANYASAARRPYYDFEDGAEASVPHAGYLWDLAARSHVSFRNYGEFVTSGPEDGLPVSTTHRALQSTTDTRYPTFDMAIHDVKRLAEWRREFDAYERTRTLPAFEIVRFPRDHTSGTRAGENTPQAMVADNDLAVGGLIDAVSHSPDWASTAIFVLEDDAQNGPDHVDEQRSTFYLASPYAAGGVQHAQYTTASVVRTIEILLGMPPLSAYDGGAAPLYEAFTATPNLAPFDALAATYDVNAKNGSAAPGAAASAQLDFSHADEVPDGVLNTILWHAVKGPDAPLPRYGEFR
jgi:YVTN family beta-propeller protein